MAGRQLRPRLVGLCHQTSRFLVLRSPRPARTTSTLATAATVLRLRLPRGSAAEQRLDCRAHFLLHQVANHREQALLSRHPVLLSGGIYTNARSPAQARELAEPASS